MKALVELYTGIRFNTQTLKLSTTSCLLNDKIDVSN